MKNRLSVQTLALGLVTSVLLLAGKISYSQSLEDFPAFGTISNDDINLKKCDFDKQANAVIIFDIAKSYYNDEHNLVTDHRTKIKILNAKGLENADITLPFISKDEIEYISNINGITTNIDEFGGTKVTKLSNKTVFNKKINQFHSAMRFSMPDVKAGSIIEYSYTSTLKHYGYLEDWTFQTELPTLVSAYDLTLLPNSEFAYKVFKSKELPIIVDKKSNAGSIFFEMKNIAGLHNEPYMDSRNDNLQHVTFQWSAQTDYMGKSTYYNKWEDVAPQLLNESFLGGQLNKSLADTDDFIAKTKTLSGDVDKIKAVLAFVQKRIGWNGFVSRFTADGVKKAWEKGSGTNGEINLIFVNLLQNVGVAAYPLLASDRWHGKVDIDYPFLDQFNQTVAYIDMPGKPALVIDAADKNMPIHMIPLEFLNTYAYIVGKKKKGLVLLEDKSHFYKNMVLTNATVSPEGVLKGNVQDFSYDYERLERKNYFNKNGKEKYIEKYLKADYTNLRADSLEMVNMDNDSLSLEQQARFEQTLNTSGEYTFLDCHLFSGIGKNPFTDDIRFSDINFGSSQMYVANQEITIPDNYTVDGVPKNVKMITPDTAFTLIRMTEVHDKKILTQVKLEIRNSFYSVEDYPMLKEFYKKMYDMLDEQIVLKKKAN